MTDVEVQARGEEYKQNAEKALEQAADLDNVQCAGDAVIRCPLWVINGQTIAG